jgi:CheY-like chemotaxis protein
VIGLNKLKRHADKLRILIVDDYDYNIHALKSVLHFTCKVDVTIIDMAFNGREALDKIKANVKRFGRCTYDIVFMDCHMPILDGYQAATRIREYLLRKTGV